MPFLPFIQQKIASTGDKQPLMGTTLSAASIPGANVVLTVAAPNLFEVGDEVWIDITPNAERAKVTAVGATTITVSQLTLSHAIGAFVMLSRYCSNIYVQPTTGNTGSLSIHMWRSGFTNSLPAHGRNSLVPSSTVTCGTLLWVGEPVTSPTQPIDFNASQVFGANPENLAFWWIVGTADDTYLVTITED